MKSLAILMVFTSLGFAATDYNSSRSNRTTAAAIDLTDDLIDISKISSIPSDEIDKDLALKVKKVEMCSSYLQDRMLVDIVIKGVFANLKKYGCRDLSDEKCITRAVEQAENKAYRIMGRGDRLVKEGDQYCGTTNHL